MTDHNDHDHDLDEADTTSPDILPGKRAPLTAGRKLAKTPIFIVVGMLVIALMIAMYAIVTAGKHGDAAAGSDGDDSAGAKKKQYASAEVPDLKGKTTGDIAAAGSTTIQNYCVNGKKTDPVTLQQVPCTGSGGGIPQTIAKVDANGQPVLDQFGRPVMIPNPAYTAMRSIPQMLPKLDDKGNPVLDQFGRPMMIPNPAYINAQNAGGGQGATNQPTPGSAEDYANKRRLMLLEAERQKLSNENSSIQAINAAKIARVSNQNQQEFASERAAAQMLDKAIDAPSTISGQGAGGSRSGSPSQGFAAGGVAAGAASPRAPGSQSQDDQNNQAAKSDWAKSGHSNSEYHSKPVMPPFSPYEVKAGTIIPSVLVTGLNSDIPGQVVARVAENVYDTTTGEILLIPQGSTLVGTFDNGVTYGQERAQLAWTRLIFKDGTSITLDNMPGSDQSGYSGFADQVNNHYLRIFGGATLMAILSAGANVSNGSNNTSTNGTTVSPAQATNQALGQQYSQVGTQLVQRNMRIAPTIVVRPGYRFTIIVNRDLVLRPFPTPNKTLALN